MYPDSEKIQKFSTLLILILLFRHKKAAAELLHSATAPCSVHSVLGVLIGIKQTLYFAIKVRGDFLCSVKNFILCHCLFGGFFGGNLAFP